MKRNKYIIALSTPRKVLEETNLGWSFDLYHWKHKKLKKGKAVFVFNEFNLN